MEMILLFWEFFKTGLFAVGGGMATIPFLTKMSERYPDWFTLAMLADMIAISESTPGPIGINMATYVGYKVAGVFGSLTAVFALVLPSFVILFLIARILQVYKNNKYVKSSFLGLRPAVTGLIAAAGYSVLLMAAFEGGEVDLIKLALFGMFFFVIQIKKLKNIHPAVYIGISAVIGIVFSL